MEILKKEGLAGLYAGLDSSIAGIVVTNTVFYLFREYSPSPYPRITFDCRPGLTDRVSMLLLMMMILMPLIPYCSRRIETDHPRPFG